MSNCPLCLSSNSNFLGSQKVTKIEYQECIDCGLSFASSEFHLKKEEEQKRYEEHNNHIKDEGYIRFLSKLLNPLSDFISSINQGLDYGSGPYPMLCEIMKDRGFQNMDAYDPIFREFDFIGKQYDFITSTEVFEHFYDPRIELERIDSILKKGGVLAIMTEFKKEEIDVLDWWYTRDHTHVSLYSPKTLNWIEKHMGYKIVFNDQKSVVIYRK